MYIIFFFTPVKDFHQTATAIGYTTMSLENEKSEDWQETAQLPGNENNFGKS